jgi:hypothetical protein
MIKEEAMEILKTRSEVKGTAVDRIWWKHFTDVLYSRGSSRN